MNSENKYRSSDVGPYIVYVEYNNTNDEQNKNIGRLHPIRVGHYMQKCDNFRNNIIDIKAIGVNRVKVIFRTYMAANELIGNEILKNNSLIAYIPTFFTQKKGIIRRVDTYFDDDYLKSAIQSHIKVVDVKRMKRRIVDDEGKSILVDRQVIIVTFLGNTIPEKVVINNVVLDVEKYIYPVVQCFGCFHYGHTAKQCKSQTKCKKCGEILTDQTHVCTQEDYCIHCKTSDHNSVNKKCPFYIKQQNIKKIMSSENVSFKEAEKLYNNPTYAKITTSNRFSLLSEIEFLNLPSTSKNKPQITNTIAKPKLTQNPQKRKKPSSPIIQQSTQYIHKEKPKTSVIPNPYREESLIYKQEIANQFSNLFVNLIKKLVPQIDLGSTAENNIKDQIKMTLDNLTEIENKTNNDSKI